jgi:glycosidase
MSNPCKFVRQTIAVLMAFGSIASLLPGFAAEPAGPQWSRGLPIYQISPRFYSKDGSLASIKADLPRIKAMNVGIIYMMPIHPCTDDPDPNAQRKCNYFQSADYMAVNPVLGTMDDWKDFVQAVHDSGMYLILDYVPKHCSWQNPLVTERPEWFSGTSWGLPAFDFSRQDVRDYHLSVMEFWVKETGVDGFRIDVAGTIPRDVFEDYRPVMDTWKEVFMLAEAQGPIHHPQYDMTYDWRLLELMVKGLANGSRPASDLDALIRDDITNYPEGALRLRHTDNHDFNIGLTQFGKVEASLERRYHSGDKAFATLCATLPGKFMFFNGNEINNTKVIPHGGTTGWIDWVENPEYTAFYTKLCQIHRDNPAIWGGSYRYLNTTRNDHLFVMERKKGDNVVFVVLNLSASQTVGTISDVLPEGDFTDAFTNGTGPLSRNVDLPGWGYRVYVKDTPPRPNR